MSTKPVHIDGVVVDVMFGDPRQPGALPLEHPKARYPGHRTERRILPKGWVRRGGALPLPCAVLWERDLPVKLRDDGVVLWVDVFRPVVEEEGAEEEEGEKVPAILAWSPYGKAGLSGCQTLDDFPFRLGVARGRLSELQKWEGPDPGYWVQYGYAVVNVDSRGAGMSGGDIQAMGSQEGRDGKEVVDWVGTRKWCNGRVGMSGNSWLGASQWYIAAEKPKHLACIAPWEGFGDLFADLLVLGGLPARGIMNFLLGILALNAGTGSWENPVAMALKALEGKVDDEELGKLGKYFADKRARVEDIEVPTYVTAAWGNPIHTYGTFRVYQLLKAPKWLRVHDSFEWPDYYSPSSLTSLHLFFDYYLKLIPNNWDLTPRFRAQVMDTANPYPLTGSLLSASDFPLPRSMALPLKLFFSPNNTLSTIYPPSSLSSFNAQRGELSFDHLFENETVLCGTVNMHLFTSLHGKLRDADIHIFMEKVTTAGKVGGQLMIPFQYTYQSLFIRAVANFSTEAQGLLYKGPYGCVRVSSLPDTQEEPGEAPGMPSYPVGGAKRMLAEGEVVEVRPCVAPLGMRFGKGERLRVRVRGRDDRAFPGLDGALGLSAEDKREVIEDGDIKVHFGGMEASWVEVDAVLS